MAKAKKSKGFLAAAGSLLGSIPAVGSVKNAAKKVKQATKKTVQKVKKVAKVAKKTVNKTVKKKKKQLAASLKKAKKKVKKAKKKIGKVFTKARKLKNNLSPKKQLKKLKKNMKKAVLNGKKIAKKAKSAVKKASKTVVKATKKVMKKTVLLAKGLNPREVASAVVDFIPFVGNAKAAYESLVGKDPITGRKLEDWERVAAGAAIVGGAVVKGVARTSKVLSAVAGGGKAAKKSTKSIAKPPESKKSESKTKVPEKMKVTTEVVSGVERVADKAQVPKGTGKNVSEVKFTKEQLATKPPYARTPEKWIEKGGTVKIDKDGTWVYTNVKGETVRYPNGYPDFTPYAHPDVPPVTIKVHSPKNNQKDFEAANLEAGLSKDSHPPVPKKNQPPEDYTWHHHEDGKTMILVDTDIHDEFTHIGGQSKVNGKNKK